VVSVKCDFPHHTSRRTPRSFFLHSPYSPRTVKRTFGLNPGIFRSLYSLRGPQYSLPPPTLFSPTPFLTSFFCFKDPHLAVWTPPLFRHETSPLSTRCQPFSPPPLAFQATIPMDLHFRSSPFPLSIPGSEGPYGRVVCPSKPIPSYCFNPHAALPPHEVKT